MYQLVLGHGTKAPEEVLSSGQFSQPVSCSNGEKARLPTVGSWSWPLLSLLCVLPPA